MKRHPAILFAAAMLIAGACAPVPAPTVDEAGIFLTEEQQPYTEEPYIEEEVRFQVGDITLAGTLTLPSGARPKPAVILISGGRADDRDATSGKFKPFRLLADHLASEGIAVLRYDDRGELTPTADEVRR